MKESDEEVNVMKRDCSTVCNSWRSKGRVHILALYSPPSIGGRHGGIGQQGGMLSTKACGGLGNVLEGWFPTFEATL